MLLYNIIGCFRLPKATLKYSVTLVYPTSRLCLLSAMDKTKEIKLFVPTVTPPPPLFSFKGLCTFIILPHNYNVIITIHILQGAQNVNSF